MKRLIYISLLLLAAACSKQTSPEDSPMLMNAMTKSPTDFGADTPVFLFWLDTDFELIGKEAVQPYLEAWPYQNIDSFKDKTYDTGKKYPENDQTVCCTGYFPSTLTVDDSDASRTWTKLSVPAEDIGIMDVMVAPEHITGKSTQHFETKTPKEPLVFHHAQSKVIFKAKMGTDMAQNRYLRNITVSIPGSELMSSLIWEDGRYTAYETAADEVNVVLKDPSTTQLDPSQSAREIGHVYTFPGKTSINIRAEVEMSDTPLFTESTIISLNTEIPYNFTDGISNALRENDAYEIILVINYDSIVLKGRKAEWEEGGGLLIPIYPEKD